MKTLTLLFFFSLSTMLSAQPLSQQLGGIKTDFTIYFQSQQVEVLDQVVIKRGLSNYQYETDGILEHAYGFGYGLQTYRLEVMSPVDFEIEERRRKSHYRLVFFGEDGTKLLSRYLSRSHLFVLKGDVNFYSINLEDIPMLLLDNTASIDIEFVY
ncbi:hypothetical protein [Lewinella sp. 4G2]|uniref:hypothetical protein n=1 Tax=Lewinella sp. 4G2 TaxID=1803372 RepID=UPI0007B4DB5A|nr:hypothetical protein [Lewinella sp. 4G2]OAV45142.1 hypothetical protein A3850_011860 [Lewinella sp. 4G2]